ncbi:hypothetical protein, partial [Salmonella enterica]
VETLKEKLAESLSVKKIDGK